MTAIFNWEVYKRLNPELVRAGLKTKQQFQNHYLMYGKKEGRKYYDSNVNSVTNIKKPITKSVISKNQKTVNSVTNIKKPITKSVISKNQKTVKSVTNIKKHITKSITIKKKQNVKSVNNIKKAITKSVINKKKKIVKSIKKPITPITKSVISNLEQMLESVIVHSINYTEIFDKIEIISNIMFPKIILLHESIYGTDLRRDTWYDASCPANIKIYHQCLKNTEYDVIDTTINKNINVINFVNKQNINLNMLYDLFTTSDHIKIIDILRELFGKDYNIPSNNLDYYNLLKNNFLEIIYNHIINYKNNYSLIIAFNLPCLIAAVIIKNIYNVSIFYEALEFYPYNNSTNSEGVINFLKELEGYFITYADNINCVNPLLGNIMETEYNVKINSLTNCVPKSQVMYYKRNRQTESKCRFLYQGDITSDRNLDLLINIWNKTNENAILIIRGEYSSYTEELIQLAKKYYLYDKRIFFPTKIKTSELLSAINDDSDIGIIPYSHKYCSSNKLGEFISMYKPILSNDTEYVKSVITENNCGESIDFNNTQLLIDTINELTTNYDLRCKYSKNSEICYNNNYNWENKSQNFYKKVNDFSRPKKNFDCVIMLTWSDWKTESVSNRYHYATRFAKVMPVYFIQINRPTDNQISFEEVQHNITIVYMNQYTVNTDTDIFLDYLKNNNKNRPLIWIYNFMNYKKIINYFRTCYTVFHGTELYLTDTDEHIKNTLISFIHENIIDLLVGVSSRVIDSFVEHGYNGDKILLSNGCDFGIFLNIKNNMINYNNSNKIVIYQGSINDRIDFILLEQIIQKLPDWSFWFCGKVEPTTIGWFDLLHKSYNNIAYKGYITDVNEIGKYICESTVGIIPFNKTDLMYHSFPLKTFEYIACGLNVISIPIKDLIDVSNKYDVIKFASTADEFVKHIIDSYDTRHDEKYLKIREISSKKYSYDNNFIELRQKINYI
jgi:glycosyltransferase involved in cell wall biosynthesis